MEIQSTNKVSKRPGWSISKYWVLAFLIAVVESSIPRAAEACTSITCNNEAERIIEYRDASVKPCDNFFRFVCGNYEKLAGIQSDEIMPMTKIDVGNLIKDEISDFKPYQFVDSLFKTCMNPNSLGNHTEYQSIVHINTLLRSLVFKKDGSKGATFDWIGFTSKAKKIGYDTTFFLDFKPAPTYGRISSLRYSIQMAPTYFDHSIASHSMTQRELYLQYIGNITRLMGDEVSGDTLKNMYAFESKLADITVPESKFYTKDISFEELEKRWPSIDWKRLIDEVLMPFVDANEKPIFTVWDENALTEFAKLMKETSPIAQAHYGIWKVQQFSVPYLTEEIREAQKVFHRQIGYPIKPRNVVCEEAVKKYAEYAIQYMYLNKHQNSVKVIKKMTESIKKEMIKIAKESKVLDKEAKEATIDVLETLPVTIGSSKILTDSKELEKFYAEARVSKDNYLQTILDLNVFKAKKEFSNKIHQEFFQYQVINKKVLGIPHNSADHLYIPLNMISSEFFEVNRPMYMNFGAAGAFIAREMFKSVAHIGRWTENGTEIPNDQYDCFNNMALKFTDPFSIKAIYQNAVRDFVDYHIGFRTVYAAYQGFVKKSGVEPKLPRLPYSQEQLFWISFAHPLCFVNIEPKQPRTYGNNHSTMFEYMFMGIFANVQQISIDFQCPVGSPLNPEHKCFWW